MTNRVRKGRRKGELGVVTIDGTRKEERGEQRKGGLKAAMTVFFSAPDLCPLTYFPILSATIFPFPRAFFNVGILKNR